VGSAMLLVWVALTAAVAVRFTVLFGAEWMPDEKMKDITGAGLAHVFFFGDGGWEDAVFDDVRNIHFTRMYGTLFNAYRPGRQWFLTAEMATSIAAGIISAVTPSNGDCTVVGIALTVVFGVYMIAVAALRPYASTLDTLVAVVTAVLMFVASILMTIAASQPTTDLSDDLGIKSAEITVSGMYVIGVKGVIDLILFVYETVTGAVERRHKRREQREAAARAMEQERADADDAKRKLDAIDVKYALLTELQMLRPLPHPPLLEAPKSLCGTHAVHVVSHGRESARKTTRSNRDLEALLNPLRSSSRTPSRRAFSSVHHHDSSNSSSSSDAGNPSGRRFRSAARLRVNRRNRQRPRSLSTTDDDL
jgi:hypothetical protein